MPPLAIEAPRSLPGGLPIRPLEAVSAIAAGGLRSACAGFA